MWISSYVQQMNESHDRQNRVICLDVDSLPHLAVISWHYRATWFVCSLGARHRGKTHGFHPKRCQPVSSATSGCQPAIFSRPHLHPNQTPIPKNIGWPGHPAIIFSKACCEVLEVPLLCPATSHADGATTQWPAPWKRKKGMTFQFGVSHYQRYHRIKSHSVTWNQHSQHSWNPLHIIYKRFPKK